MLLEQQELLETVPSRRLIVPHGHGSFWGVDTSVRGIAVGWVDAAGARGAFTIPLRELEGGQRLAYAFETVRDWIRDAVAGKAIPLPGLVLVEQPSGKFDKPQLSYMVGVVQGAVYAGAVLGGATAPRVETIPSPSWKLASTGFGGHKKTMRVPGKAKPVPVPHDEYAILKWARLHGYGGTSWDEADALAMAEAGRRTVCLEQR